MPRTTFLVIEKGTPHEKGTRITLPERSWQIGRVTSSIVPDLGFDNFLVSRTHCRLDYRDGQWLLVDMGSKHGTTLNGVPIEPERPYQLREGDRIGLAEGAALFRFVETWEFEKTMDWGSTQPFRQTRREGSPGPIVADMDKMELWVDGESIILSAKEWQFFALLYRSRNRMVDYSEIRTAVWPERNWDHGKVPDVGVEEMNVLIYRVRKKLGTHGKALRTIRGRGCILEI